jgi:hypothetical protein
MKIRQLTLAEAEYIAHRLAVEVMNPDDETYAAFSYTGARQVRELFSRTFPNFQR